MAAKRRRLGARYRGGTHRVVPVMLSPAVDAAAVGALLGQLDQLHLRTDRHKLDALAAEPVADPTNRVVIVTGSRPGAASLTELAGSPRGPSDGPATKTA